MVNTGQQPGVNGSEARTMLELGELPAYLAMPAVMGLISTHIGLGAALQLAVLSAFALSCLLIVKVTPHRYRPA